MRRQSSTRGSWLRWVLIRRILHQPWGALCLVLGIALFVSSATGLSYRVIRPLQAPTVLKGALMQLWVFPLCALAVTFWLARRRHSQRLLCPACDYPLDTSSRRGVEYVCPECGFRFTDDEYAAAFPGWRPDSAA